MHRLYFWAIAGAEREIGGLDEFGTRGSRDGRRRKLDNKILQEQEEENGGERTWAGGKNGRAVRIYSGHKIWGSGSET